MEWSLLTQDWLSTHPLSFASFTKPSVCEVCRIHLILPLFVGKQSTPHLFTRLPLCTVSGAVHIQVLLAAHRTLTVTRAAGLTPFSLLHMHTVSLSSALCAVLGVAFFLQSRCLMLTQSSQCLLFGVVTRFCCTASNSDIPVCLPSAGITELCHQNWLVTDFLFLVIRMDVKYHLVRHWFSLLEGRWYWASAHVLWTGEMAQELRTLVEHPGSSSKTHMVAHSCL